MQDGIPNISQLCVKAAVNLFFLRLLNSRLDFSNTSDDDQVQVAFQAATSVGRRQQQLNRVLCGDGTHLTPHVTQPSSDFYLLNKRNFIRNPPSCSSLQYTCKSWSVI